MILRQVHVLTYEPFPRSNGKVSDTEKLFFLEMRFSFNWVFWVQVSPKWLLPASWEQAPGGFPRQTLNHHPRAARHSAGGGGDLQCYFNTMHARQTPHNLILDLIIVLQGGSRGQTLTHSSSPPTIQTRPLLIWVGCAIFLYIWWLFAWRIINK